jgi:hypothetical protein
MLVRTALVVLLLACTTSGASAQSIELRSGAFKVSGWKPDSSIRTEDLPAIFAIYTGGPTDVAAPPLLGTYSIENGVPVFHPRFPLVPNVTYRAVLSLPGRSPVETVFKERGRDSTAVGSVEHIYPSANVLPGNALRLYVYFSAPMSRGEAWKRIHLVDESGKADPLAFLVAEELWDPDYRRLTVFFDPGRIKRGVLPNLELGLPIADGKQYTVVIDREFQDANGLPLKETFRKTFRGTAPERAPIDLKQWLLSSPKAGTLETLDVEFPEPLDYALLQRCLKIPGVAGTVSIDRDEKRWRFTPAEAWKPGEYKLTVDSALEDLAGNRIDRPFDVDISENRSESSVTGTMSLPFRVMR